LLLQLLTLKQDMHNEESNERSVVSTLCHLLTYSAGRNTYPCMCSTVHFLQQSNSPRLTVRNSTVEYLSKN